MTLDNIGFIGTGAMGGAMASRLLAAKFPLTVYDVDPAALAPLRRQGARVAATPREVADCADIVFACLPSPAVSQAVALGESGVAGGRAIKIYIETSTIGSEAVMAIATGLRASGVSVLDAPVSGGPQGALGGTLSTVVSGPSADFARARPAIACFASHVFYLGSEPGQAQIAKLINNMLSVVGRVMTFEGMTLAMQVGIDPKLLADFVNVSTGRNMATMHDFPSRLQMLFNTGQKKSIPLKDIELYLEEARRHDAPVWTGPKARELLLEAARLAEGEPESQRLKDYVARLAALRQRK